MSTEPPPLVWTDGLGRGRYLPGPARRIVSLVPSLTETLFHLGAGDCLVGVTDYCTEPAGGVKDLARVGGPKTVDVERLLALRPDLVLADPDENDREQAGRIEAEGVVLHAAKSNRVADVSAEMRLLGRLTDREGEGERLARRIEATAARLLGEPFPYHRPRVLILVWKNPFYAAGDGTYISDLIHTAGGANAFPGQEGYFEVDKERLARLRPDRLLLPTDPYPWREVEMRELAEMLWGRPRHYGAAWIADGRTFTWYGPRTPRGLLAADFVVRRMYAVPPPPGGWP